ncbi:60S ribosomal subunit assembly/export protein LOC1 [Erysiphe neolycopersici]|uniref:60S ribosomal subunit assembly/export protein LOC1 n=1 Tax=Erysiphe neolycopersici TaxID=212602 RepID=A0A420I0L8_9PEZI|nr:60S ribosomal subunit assembly/export protein LOC1 [Erysiphe neolycopersici]
MAPSRTSTVKNKYKVTSQTSSTKLQPTRNKTQGGSKSRISKGTKSSQNKKNDVGNQSKFRHKKKIYTEKELDIPTLNMITPIGVQKPKNKKKGKIFVDDTESMMTILSIVNAEKSGQIESKMIKARQMEEIREARRVESEKRQEIKKTKMNEIKNSMRKKRNRTNRIDEDVPNTEPDAALKPRKRVSFVSGDGS